MSDGRGTPTALMRAISSSLVADSIERIDRFVPEGEGERGAEPTDHEKIRPVGIHHIENYTKLGKLNSEL